MEPVFVFKHVRYQYNKDRAAALNGIDFEIPLRKKTAIVGPNGAGKSTLIFHMNGLYSCASGEVWFKGEQVSKANQSDLVRHVGVVFQDPDDQIISMTVRDDIAFGPTQLGLPAGEAFRKADESMELLHISHLAKLNPHELSFGQKKQVAIAGIVAMDPDVVILDEPMAFLDPAGQKRVQEIMNLLMAKGKTVIVATHNMQLVAEWADHVVVVKDGQCLGSLTPRELFCQHPHLLKEAHLELPLVLQLFSGLWEEQSGPMPVTMEEARAVLSRLLTNKTGTL
ncbi:energy-coupling factor ABC transporter ATP-binding protein [Paenibacillus allorhizosphaerae]|uniref:Energy-coupling factor transporter ATP-binding protein EcfA3 n=1 Tax=Paenibacillus allorhizosphaerae TaxID=2849866 RepID=A0ABN7TD81_9BACL|nr:ATP-binding cassette domain-containing protein [Paenibacillus allorhizosphaerae]CAG7622603.1 Energy-coupling factor transporter ATP-binding protein EcfA3 [Paenibacillus allorhizosphaerae]